MRLRIEHRTVYRYAEPIARGVQLVRLFPTAQAGTAVLSWRVTAKGGRVGQPFLDGFANRTALIDLDSGATTTEIRVNGHVETHDFKGRLDGAAEPLPSSYFLRETRLTTADQAIRGLTVKGAGADGAIALMHLVRDKVEYQTGATDVSHTAAEAFAQGAGVCQDHAHIFLAAARAHGLPARYVSGYLFAGESWHAASHAWVEAFVDDFWLALDPANRTVVDDHYVRLAGGLDYADARPISGVRFGGAEETLHVDVDVQQQQ